MSGVARVVSVVRASRSLARISSDLVLARSFDRYANALVVRTTSKGAPSYREGEAAAKFTKTLDLTAAFPDSPNTTTPASSAVFDLAPFADAVFYWKLGTGAYASVDVEFWVETDDGTWLLLAGQQQFAALPLVEYLVAGVGYRRLFARPTAKGAGADGTVVLTMAGA
mgnify:CR=1 FL=1